MTKKPSSIDHAPGTHRDRQKARTRRLIMNAARTLFEKHGFDETTIRAVAAEAGVGLGTVMSHFPDKATLLIRSLVDDWDAVLTDTMSSLPLEAGFRDQVLHLIGAYYRNYARRPALSRVLLKELLFASGPGGRDIQVKAAQLMDISIARLEHAKTQGQVRPDADCALASQAIFAFYLKVLYEGMDREKPDPDEMIEELARLIDQFLAGIAP